MNQQSLFPQKLLIDFPQSKWNGADYLNCHQFLFIFHNGWDSISSTICDDINPNIDSKMDNDTTDPYGPLKMKQCIYQIVVDVDWILLFALNNFVRT